MQLSKPREASTKLDFDSALVESLSVRGFLSGCILVVEPASLSCRPGLRRRRGSTKFSMSAFATQLTNQVVQVCFKVESGEHNDDGLQSHSCVLLISEHALDSAPDS